MTALQKRIRVASLTVTDQLVLCAWLLQLGNIAGDNEKCRDLVLAAGALPQLLDLCTQDATLLLLRTVTWMIFNLCRSVN